MLTQLKNYQILDLNEAFIKIAERSIKSNKTFSYAVILNDESMQPKIKALQGIAKPSESYGEYEQKRNDILVEYAKTDGEGNILLNENQSVTFKDGSEETVMGLITDLNTEYSDIVDERNADIAEYNQILEKEIEVNLERVDIDDVPDEVGEDLFLMKMLMTMID